MDLVVQKSTELGVSEIVPLFTEHCEVKLNAERQEKRVEHWQQVAISACEQTGRVIIPVIRMPQKIAEWIESPGAGLKLLYDHNETGKLDGARPQGGIALLIGPEGGLSDSEISKARAAGFTGINLGNRVLRTETAPITALSILQYLWA